MLFLIKSRHSLRRFLDLEPKLERTLHITTIEVLLMRHARSIGSIFYAFEERELQMAARKAQLQKAKQGEIICKKGDPPGALYVVANGEAEKDYEDGKAVERLRAGAFFNELGILLENTKTVATVKVPVSSACTVLLRLDKVHFDEIVGNHQISTGTPASAIITRPTMPESFLSRGGKAVRMRAVGMPPGGSVRPPPEKHNLLRRLRFNVLIKLMKTEVPMAVLLQDPDAHLHFVVFLLPALRGGLRLHVYNEAVTLLARLRVALHESHKVTPMNSVEYDDFLLEQVRSPALPCPSFA